MTDRHHLHFADRRPRTRPTADHRATAADRRGADRARATAQSSLARTCRWRNERRLVGAFLDALLAMNQEIVPELAWQMGRPVRYGGRVARRRGARALHGRASPTTSAGAGRSRTDERRAFAA